MDVERFLATQRFARILRGGKAHAAASTLLRAKYQQYCRMKSEMLPVIEIKVRRVVG